MHYSKTSNIANADTRLGMVFVYRLSSYDMRIHAMVFDHTIPMLQSWSVCFSEATSRFQSALESLKYMNRR
eukprot:UN14673